MTIISSDFPNQNWIWILPAVARLMRKSELTESRVQKLDLDLEIHTQSTDMTTNIKKGVIKGTNLLRNGYLQARDALQRHRPPHQTTDKVLRVGLGLRNLPSCIMPNPESVRGVVRILRMTEAEVIKEDVTTIRNKTPKLVKGRHPNRSQSGFQSVEDGRFFLEQIATHMGLSSQASVDAEPGPAGEPQRPGPTLYPHHNGALPKRIVDLGRRRDDDEVSLLASDEGIPDPPQVGQDLSQVCFNPVPDVTTKWSPHEVITSYVSKYFCSKTDKEAISAQILEDHGTPDINNFVGPQINQTILMAAKVQSAKECSGE